MGDGDGTVPLADVAHAIRPDRVGHVGPVVIALGKALPTLLSVLGPGAQAEQLVKRSGVDDDAVIEIGLVRKRGDPQQFLAERPQLTKETAGLTQLVGEPRRLAT